MNEYYDEYYECIHILEDDEEPNPLYGMEFDAITPDMIKALQDGKRLYISVNDEYAVVLKLGGAENV